MQHGCMIHVQDPGNWTCRLERRPVQYRDDVWVDVIDCWSSDAPVDWSQWPSGVRAGCFPICAECFTVCAAQILTPVFGMSIDEHPIIQHPSWRWVSAWKSCRPIKWEKPLPESISSLARQNSVLHQTRRMKISLRRNWPQISSVTCESDPDGSVKAMTKRICFLSTRIRAISCVPTEPKWTSSIENEIINIEYIRQYRGWKLDDMGLELPRYWQDSRHITYQKTLKITLSIEFFHIGVRSK
jgi:hypothetical protein